MNIHGLKKSKKAMTVMIRKEREKKMPSKARIEKLERAKENCSESINQKRKSVKK